MKNVMKRNVPATLLAVILIFSLCLSFTAFAEGETQETGTETAAETAAENITEPVAEVTAEEVVIDISAAELPTEPLEPIETVESASEGVLLSEDATEAEVTEGDSAEETEPAEATTEEEKKEKEEKTEEEDDPVKKLAEVRSKLTKIEENGSFDIKETYDQYEKLETEEEQAAFIAAIPEADEESDDNANLFREYLTLKTEEQALLVKVEALKEKNPEAAKISEVEAELKFAEEEIAAAEAEIAALEETAEAETTAQEETGEAESNEMTAGEETKDETIETENVESEQQEASEQVIEQQIIEEQVTEEQMAEAGEDVTADTFKPTEEVESEGTTESSEAAVLSDAENLGTAEEPLAEENTELEKVEYTENAENEEESEDAAEIEPEENLPEESATITETETGKKIDLWYQYDGELEYGKEILINSNITGYGDNISLQWYYSTDGINYAPIEGAVAPTYLFVLDETNCWYYWDLIATEQYNTAVG